MISFDVYKCLLVFSILCSLTRPVLSDCLNAPIENFDYFPNKITFNTEVGKRAFDVTYHDTYVVVTSKKFLETYVLYCTAAQPAGAPADATSYIQVPVKNVAILGEELKLKYVLDKKTITSPCLQKHNDLYEQLSPANTAQMAGTDVIFQRSPSITGGKFVSIFIDEETKGLKGAEWIKFISLFFNKTDVANEAYNQILNNYLCHVDNVSKVPNKTKKTIAWVSLESDNTFTIKHSLFYSNLTMDAAAYPLISMMSNVDVVDLHKELNDAYIVIDLSELTPPNDTLDAWKRLFGYQTSIEKLPNFLTQKRLFRTRKLLNKMAHNDWDETSPSRPDLVLQDLIAIQYPSYQKDYYVRWFDKFAETGDVEILTEQQCDESTFGLPKNDFGTCVPMQFTGDSKDINGNKVNAKDGDGKYDDNNSNDKKKVKPGVIVAGALAGAFVILGLGVWSLIVARRKYRERFVKLKDEHESQSKGVKEVNEK
ncbi:11779_t:CDS:2 [Funneliformis caledonium]|uniref:11779_t:CDS:1 n=1 Tax=Funneliformis caledonium TaxID=1117310 RepID=A0A9N9A9A9_9GLOM|nr:11779_t:CDS:2 [Funneliformis caledonium]